MLLAVRWSFLHGCTDQDVELVTGFPRDLLWIWCSGVPMLVAYDWTTHQIASFLPRASRLEDKEIIIAMRDMPPGSRPNLKRPDLLG